MTKNLYSDKTNSYFSLIRSDIIKLVPLGTKRILDVGCGSGLTGKKIKTSAGADFVAGIELNEEAANSAKSNLDLVICGDIETIDLDFKDKSFDCIICADVLEHLKDPWQVLVKLSEVLKADGILIASIPNIRNIKPLIKIILDKFEYETEGILDRTHLRFFTFHTIYKMFDECGFTIVKKTSNRIKNKTVRAINTLTLFLFKDFFITQHIIVAKKKKKGWL